MIEFIQSIPIPAWIIAGIACYAITVAMAAGAWCVLDPEGWEQPNDPTCVFGSIFWPFSIAFWVSYALTKRFTHARLCPKCKSNY